MKLPSEISLRSLSRRAVLRKEAQMVRAGEGGRRDEVAKLRAAAGREGGQGGLHGT